MDKKHDYLDDISSSLERQSEQDLLSLVVKRNETIYRGFQTTPITNRIARTNGGNLCELLTSLTSIPVQYQVYHSGPPFQSVLTEKQESSDFSTDANYVFFSLDLEGVVVDYVIPEGFEDRVVYVADARRLLNARVQTSYDSEVIWNDKLRTLLTCYDNSEHLRMLLEEYSWCADAEYVRDFKDRPREELKRVAIKEMQDWIDKYTVPFKSEELDSYRENDWNYVLIPEPIEIV